MKKIIFSPDQQNAFREIEYFSESPDEQERTMGGYAGTGKTLLISELRNRLSCNIEYCAPTGKASRVLAAKLGLEGKEVRTIHQVVYKPNEVHCVNCPRNENKLLECHADSRSKCGCDVEWMNKPKQDKPSLFVVDESSMIDQYLYRDLVTYVGGAKLLFVGDHGQLPPVNSRFNLMANPDIRLEEIHRQVADSPILKVAMLARTTGKIPYKEFGPGVMKVHEEDADSIDLDDEDSLLLCYTNAKRVQVNKQIREAMGHSGRPKVGERVICLRNNWPKGLYNGLTGVIKHIAKAEQGKYDAVIALEDGRTYEGTISAKQFNLEGTLFNDNADLFDFGYCLTVHKAQGSQKRKIILLEEHLPWVKRDMWRRWLYTAVTRAEEELVILG